MMRAPCASCPFLRSGVMPLRRGRAEEIADALRHDRGFECHKTLSYKSGRPRRTKRTAFCAGALATMENERENGGARASFLVRMGIVCGAIDLDKLTGHDLVFPSLDAWVESHR